MTPADPPDEQRTVLVGAAGATPSPPQPQPQSQSLGHNALEVGTKLGEFEVTGLVGEGGFGIVYLAYDHSLERQVALKEYMPSELAHREGSTHVAVRSKRHAETFAAGLRSFINEARLLAQFDHPSLVKVYRFWEANGTAYMVMPFYEGVTLKDALRALDTPPDEDWIKSLLVQLLDALAIIHNRQCYHRDIAPDNILVLPDETPLLLDFGAARRVIGDMTQALTVILKPGYAPIEQYAEVPNMKQGPWTDLYALASVVYFAITGQPPVPAVARVMSDPLVPLAQCAAGRYSEGFLRAIDSALAVRPQDRPQDIASFREQLGFAPRDPTTRFMQTTSGATRGASSPTVMTRPTAAQTVLQPLAAVSTSDATIAPAPAPARRSKVLLMGVGAAASIAIGLLVFFLNGKSPQRVEPASDPAAKGVDAPAGNVASQINARLAAFDCARLEAGVDGGNAVIRGHVGSDADLERVRSEAQSVKGIQKVDSSAVRVFPRPYCTIASTLAPFAAPEGDVPVIALKNGGAAAFDGDKLVATVTAANFDGYLYADLYEPEGNVVHLLPNPKEKKNQVQARQRLVLGDDALFGRQWDVVAPFGKHLLVVMASRKPLFERQRPEVEDIFGYLRSVKDAIGAKTGEENFRAHYVLIEFRPKP